MKYFWIYKKKSEAVCPGGFKSAAAFFTLVYLLTKGLFVEGFWTRGNNVSAADKFSISRICSCAFPSDEEGFAEASPSIASVFAGGLYYAVARNKEGDGVVANSGAHRS